VNKQLLLSIFATILLLPAPAGFAAADSAEDATSGQAQEERRGPPPGGRHGHGPRLTDAQRACLEGILGKPGEGERPSHEKMHAAMESCGVPKPPRGGRPPRSESAGEAADDQAQ
jgi:hypothetical protein